MNASQSSKLKEYGKSGDLTLPMVRLIPAECGGKTKKAKINHALESMSKQLAEARRQL